MKKTDEYRLKEKRGTGSFENYTPWIKVHEISNIGRGRKENGIIINRIYHLLSDLEFYFFIYLQMQENVIDINEQFPLLSLETTIDISKELGVKHPAANVKLNNKKTEYKEITMTTDFLVTYLKDGNITREAYHVKYSKDSKKDRNIEKYLIEEEFWNRRGVKLNLITEEDFDYDYCKMISILYTSGKLIESHVFMCFHMDYSNELQTLLRDDYDSLNELLLNATQKYCLNRDFVRYWIEHLVIKGVIKLHAEFKTDIFFSKYEVIKCWP